MIKFYTSYYGNWRNYKDNNTLTVSISNVTPTTVDVMLERLSSNSRDLSMYKSGLIQFSELIQRYEAKLDTLDSDNILKYITEICEETKKTRVVFLCYEKDVDNCHRKVLHKFFGRSVEIHEL